MSKALTLDNQQNEVVGFDPRLPITKDDLKSALARRNLLKEFVKSQMVQDVDFGTIPGCPKPCLFKPGAEKLAQLFGFGVRINGKDKEIDLHQNFAMFSYTAEVYHLKTSVIISQCEGSCNSHERKYKTRTVKNVKEETAIGDIMNTLMKMAQKRAYVGAVIQATGASDFYTQDVDSPEEAAQVGINPPPVRASSSVPKATSAKSSDDSQAPLCCDKAMMKSKFHENTWYCLKCKNTSPMEER